MRTPAPWRVKLWRGSAGRLMGGSILTSLFFFLLALALLIAVHEFGHFWVARRLGVKVLRFSIGFGKPIWRTTRGADQTEYVLAAIPLGGYVRMLDEREGEVAEHEVHRAFNRQSVGKRFAIVLAGPLFNFMLAIAVYWLVFVLGVDGIKPIIGSVAPQSLAAEAGFTPGETIIAVDGEAVDSWQNAVMALLENTMNDEQIDVHTRDEQGVERVHQIHLRAIQKDLQQGNLLDTLGIQPARPTIPPVLSHLEPGGAAERAGLRSGDRILASDGRPVSDWDNWVEYVRARPDQVIRTEIDRAGARLVVDLQPGRRAAKEGDIGYVGAAVAVPEDLGKDYVTLVRYSPVDALGVAVKKTWDMSVLTLRMLWGMVAGDVSVANISGPISIAKYAGYSAQVGLVAFLTFLAIVSISLGVLNLLPIPVLDGGHLLYYLIEMVKGSPVSDAAQAMGQRVGVPLLLMLMTVAIYNDVVQLFK